MIAAASLFLKGISWQVYAAIALAGALVASHWWAYDKGENAGQHAVQRDWDAAKVQQRLAEDGANEQANRRGIRFAEESMARQGRIVVVTKEITHAIEAAPAWAAEPVPAGVRDAIAAAAASLAASEPDGGLRVLPAAGGDQRAAGGGLRLGAGGHPGLLGPASSPR